jgi:hypothetical protein
VTARRTKATRVAHPASSPDAALSDSFLFGCLKGEMAGLTVNSPAYILSEIRQIFLEISKEILRAVYDDWITEHKGTYHHMGSKKSSVF